ncbi:MAG TPA: hypothetical protein ENG87_05880 [Candidatus Pacearchaeota archaeon]|nr:hypothetical protein [Candidatus Pacearchaeota archaeon]
MAREPFLINPPKRGVRRRSKRKTVSIKRRKRVTSSKSIRPVLYKTGRKTYSRSRFSRTKRAGISINPIGEEVLIVGANPVAPVRRRKRGKIRKIVKRRRRRSYRYNPVSLGGFNLKKPMSLLMPVLIGVGAKMATERVPNMVNISKPFPRFGVQLAMAVGGGILLQKPLGKNNAAIWAIVSGVTAVSGLLDEFVFKQALSYVSDVAGPVSDYGNDEIDYSMSAFPDELGAYPYEDTVQY